MTEAAPPTGRKPTHEVQNQPPALEGVDLYSGDTPLREALAREGASWAEADVRAAGQRLGSRELIEAGFQANASTPVLHTHDRFGHRVDEVVYHPSWHLLMKHAVESKVHAWPWLETRPGAHVARAAVFYLDAGNESGHLCPISMTFSAVPALRKQPELAQEWEPRITGLVYDPSVRPAPQKRGNLIGMAMTEKQGGSDVRANTTRAVPAGAKTGPGAEYLLTGHKWFCSAPMSDAFLVLAQAPRGLSCFLVPRWTPDERRNGFYIQRLKDKLGNRSNASSEIELESAWGRMVGEEGRGVPTIIEMVNHTRLDCVITSAGNMRRALVEAIHHATHRSAFGRKLSEQPLMQNVLADLAVECEAATVLMMRLARAFDRRTDEREGAFQRLGTAVAKYWVCKRAPSFVVEALECHGGNGYVEESILPRLYRETPLLSIWEGSGNVNCLDVLRAMSKQPASREALRDEIALGAQDGRVKAALARLEAQWSRPDAGEAEARRLVEDMALALQGSLLVRYAPKEVSDVFVATRLAGEGGRAFGTLPAWCQLAPIVARSRL